MDPKLKEKAKKLLDRAEARAKKPPREKLSPRASRERRIAYFERQRQPVYVILPDGSGFVEGYGYRAAVLFAGEDGYHWTGEWPNDGTGVMPYFWGPTLKDAQHRAARLNARAGVTEEDAAILVGRSMARGRGAKDIGAGWIPSHRRRRRGGRPRW